MQNWRIISGSISQCTSYILFQSALLPNLSFNGDTCGFERIINFCRICREGVIIRFLKTQFPVQSFMYREIVDFCFFVFFFHTDKMLCLIWSSFSYLGWIYLSMLSYYPSLFWELLKLSCITPQDTFLLYRHSVK